MRSPCALTCTPAGGMPTSRSAAHSLATRSGGQACGRRKHSCAACEVEEPAAPIGQTSAAQGVAKACTGHARGYNETTRAVVAQVRGLAAPAGARPQAEAGTRLYYPLAPVVAMPAVAMPAAAVLVAGNTRRRPLGTGHWDRTLPGLRTRTISSHTRERFHACGMKH
eukprot:scaffold7332_cov63-Phaeocystis_antarctica.AAC.5